MRQELNVADINLGTVANIALKAGLEVMKIYNQKDFGVEFKEDLSPLTIADRKSHQTIISQLKKHFREIPILSEEGPDISYSERRDWDLYWLIDPLDGTKEYIKRNGEFTVNIALIKNQRPILGVVFAPALDLLYAAKKDFGSYKMSGMARYHITFEQDIKNHGTVLPILTKDKSVRVVTSSSHLSPETEEFIEQLKAKHQHVDTTAIGSSLKLCAVAEGKADYYPRLAPTMEWDTAAGHAIVEQAGGLVLTASDDSSLAYNKQSLYNPWFIAKSAWASMLK